MSKKRRNYNQDYFKVGGSPQPGEEQMPGQSKEKLTRERAGEKKGKGG